MFVWPRERSEVIFCCTLHALGTASLCLRTFVFIIQPVPHLDALFLLLCLVSSYMALRAQPQMPSTWEDPLIPQSHPAFLPSVFALFAVPSASPISGHKTGFGSLDLKLLWDKECVTRFSGSPVRELCLAQSCGPENVCLLRDILTKLFCKCLWNEGRDFSSFFF